MDKVSVELRRADIAAMLTVLSMHQEEGSYFGNREQWYARLERIHEAGLKALTENPLPGASSGVGS